VLGLEHATSGIMAETLQPRTCALRRGKAVAAFGSWRVHRWWSARMAFRRAVTRC
jgi:hypothetical protein